MNKEYIYVILIPETEQIIKELDNHFEKNTITYKITYSKNSFFESRLGVNYKQYKFVDMKKEFV